MENLNQSQPFSTTSLTVDWKKPEGYASSYRLFMTDILSGENFTAITNQMTHEFSDLTPGSKFQITVWAQANYSLEGDSFIITGFTSK